MFYDIKFKGEKVMYELSMQEATAQYGQYRTHNYVIVQEDTLNIPRRQSTQGSKHSLPRYILQPWY